MALREIETSGLAAGMKSARGVAREKGVMLESVGVAWVARVDTRAPLITRPIYGRDIVEQFASRQELVTNRVVMELVKTLYLDQESNRPRRGAAGKGKGSARRLTDILNQFDLTWDIHMVKVPDLIGMLPGEFDRFRAAMA